MFFISQLSKFLEGTAYSTSVTNDSHEYYCLLIDLAFPSLHVERLGVSTFRTLHVRGRRVTRNIALCICLKAIYKCTINYRPQNKEEY